jgi:hypothetical protein
MCFVIVCFHPVSCVPSVDETLSTLGTKNTGRRQTIQRHHQHWAHKIQDEDKQFRDTVNTGHSRYRMKTNNRETLSTLGTQDTGWKQTIHRHCQHWAHNKQDKDKQSSDTVNTGHTRNRTKTNNGVTLSTLVCPVLTVSLDCLLSSCFLCAQCWQCLSIVCLRPVSCVPSVDSVSRLFVFVLFLVCPVLTVSLDCLSSQTIERHCQHWAHKKQDEDKQSRNTINTGDTRYRMKTKKSRDTVNTGHKKYRTKTNNPETPSTLGTQDTGRRQTIQRHCQH